MRDGSPIQKCYRCGELKPAEDFAWRRKAIDQRDSFCRSCRAAYKKEHYAANRQLYIDRASVRKREIARERTILLLEFFRTNPCVDCDEMDPVVREFDHLRDKLFDIGGNLATQTWENILCEIEKCEVVCANCHRRRTARRRGSLRSVLSSTNSNEAGDESRTRSLSLEGSCATSNTSPARRSDYR